MSLQDNVDAYVGKIASKFALPYDDHLEWFKGEVLAYAADCIANDRFHKSNEQEIDNMISSYAVGIRTIEVDDEEWGLFIRLNFRRALRQTVEEAAPNDKA